MAVGAALAARHRAVGDDVIDDELVVRRAGELQLDLVDRPDRRPAGHAVERLSQNSRCAVGARGRTPADREFCEVHQPAKAGIRQATRDSRPSEARPLRHLPSEKL